MRTKFTQEEVSIIIREYLNGKNQKEIATMFNSYNTSIRRVLLKNNITLRDSGYASRFVRHNIFEPFDEQNDYWIGMLATDGCVKDTGGIALGLKGSDRKLLESFVSFTKVDKVKVIDGISKGHFAFSMVSFMSKETANYLTSIGITPRKSLTLALKIPLNFHILRGIIDGDGSYSPMNSRGVRLQICTASPVFQTQLFEFLISQGFNPKKRTDARATRKNPLYSVEMYRQHELNLLFELLYKDAKYFLERKYLRFGCLLKKFNSDNSPNSVKGASPTPS